MSDLLATVRPRAASTAKPPASLETYKEVVTYLRTTLYEIQIPYKHNSILVSRYLGRMGNGLFERGVAQPVVRETIMKEKLVLLAPSACEQSADEAQHIIARLTEEMKDELETFRYCGFWNREWEDLLNDVGDLNFEAVYH